MAGRPATATLLALSAAQLALAGPVIARLRRTAGGTTVPAVERGAVSRGQVSIVLPVLNEARRIGPCLEGLLAQGPEVAEILVVDGGSVDETAALVAACGARDGRVRLIDARPVPDDWNGKAWGLHVGLDHTRPASTWVLSVDADVRPGATLAGSVVAHALVAKVVALSLATAQELSGWGEGLIHPALLTTLVYRFGSPGRATRRVDEVQANGQCFLVRRDVLLAAGGFASTRHSLCEDVTLARHLARAGHAVGFYESEALISVRMYASGWEAWQNWPRSLPLRDQYAGLGAVRGLLEVTLVQALPLAALVGCVALAARPTRQGRGVGPGIIFAMVVNGLLGAIRLGILAGTARAYRQPPWSYWLSPLTDVPVALALWSSLCRRDHVWRGRRMVTEPMVTRRMAPGAAIGAPQGGEA